MIFPVAIFHNVQKSTSGSLYISQGCSWSGTSKSNVIGKFASYSRSKLLCSHTSRIEGRTVGVYNPFYIRNRLYSISKSGQYLHIYLSFKRSPPMITKICILKRGSLTQYRSISGSSYGAISQSRSLTRVTSGGVLPTSTSKSRAEFRPWYESRSGSTLEYDLYLNVLKSIPIRSCRVVGSFIQPLYYTCIKSWGYPHTKINDL